MKKIKEFEFGDVKEIYRNILDIYPFLTKQEKRFFKVKTEKLAENEKLFKKDPVLLIKSLLAPLKNPHAKVFVIKNRTGKGPVRHFQKNSILDGILYIRIYTWFAPSPEKAVKMGQELINICTEHKNKYKGIIFDVRGNGGGSSVGAKNLAAIFFKKNFTSAYIYRKEKGGFVRLARVLKHDKKQYIGVPIVILIDGECFSSTELFISPFKVGGRATLIGETTRGGSADPITLRYKLNKAVLAIKIPTWRLFLKGEKRPLEETKIKPNIVYKKKDIIKYARQYIKNKFV